ITLDLLGRMHSGLADTPHPTAPLITIGTIPVMEPVPNLDGRRRCPWPGCATVARSRRCAGASARCSTTPTADAARRAGGVGRPTAAVLERFCGYSSTMSQVAFVLGGGGVL